MLKRLSVLLLCLLTSAVTLAQSTPRADLVDDEGGPVVITGEVNYTNTFFTAGVSQPLIILEDQSGFVARDHSYVFPPASQTIGQITSDFYDSPFTYSLALPIEPQGNYNDVDQNASADAGVQIFAVAYWTNTWGDPFLEVRDLGGGGWSTAYASTRISPNPSDDGEVIGGKYLIYAPDDAQGFPSGFGDDGRLFTADDPIVLVPQGYTVVDMDSDPFVFSRPREAVIDLIEGASSALEDFSDLNYTDAFDAMVDLFRTRYAFTDYKNIDWDALWEEFRPRFERAQDRDDVNTYLLALRDFTWRIPDGHVSGPRVGIRDNVIGGLGLATWELDNGDLLVTFVADGSPGADAGIQVGATILELNGEPIADAIGAVPPWFGPYSSPIIERLWQSVMVLRFRPGDSVELVYQNPGDDPQTVELEAVEETDSLFYSFDQLQGASDPAALPVEFDVLPSGLGYVRITSFSDDDQLQIRLWERMITTLNDADIPGLIIDMRSNGGGSGFLADQMAAYFFRDELVLGNTGYYDASLGDFFFDPADQDTFILPPRNLRYRGDVVVLVGPGCASACEFFSYNMTLEDRATVIGMYPSAGLGGSVEDFKMPEDVFIRFTIGRAVDANGNIHIEGVGVVPTVRVPVIADALLGGSDTVLDAAIDFLSR